MYRRKVNKSETYCFRCSEDEREMIRHVQGKVDVPYELRKKVREIYNNLMGFSKTKKDLDDVFLP